MRREWPALARLRGLPDAWHPDDDIETDDCRKRRLEPVNTPDFPRLIADVGSTYVRMALETARGRFTGAASLRCSDHPSLGAALRAYLDDAQVGPIEHAAVAIANPVDGDQVRMTNYHWQFSIDELRREMGLTTLVVVNDFTALAMSLPRLSADDVRQVGGGQAVGQGVIGLLGAGTGLGVSGLIPSEGSFTSLASEGGHASLAPRDDQEDIVLRHARGLFGHVSFERLLSASGLELTYRALHPEAEPLSAPEISRRAVELKDPACDAALGVFCRLLGTAAGDLALTLGAKGGIYIGGSIVPRLGAYFDRSGFRERFEDKGRFRSYLCAIPTLVITADNPTFIGVSAILESQLRKLRHNEGANLVTQIQRQRDGLPPAEQRVADLVLAQPRSVLNDPIQSIAQAAQVSQPTVIRFCRSVGCKGLSDFKLKLAAGQSFSVPVGHTQVTQDDSALEFGAKVLGNTANAVLQLRHELQREAIDHAVDLVLGASRVEIFAVGSYSTLAQDAQLKLLRLGIACNAHTLPQVQALVADTVSADAVALFISSGGNLPELMMLRERVAQRGARIIAITAHPSELAAKADVALVAEHNEDVETHLPMISRVLHLLLVDILVVGLQMRLATQAKPRISHRQ